MIILCHNSQIILTHSRGFSFLTFLCTLSSGSGVSRGFTPFFTRARDIIWGRIRRRVVFNLRAFHLTIPLSLSPLYPSLSLSLSLSPSLPPSPSLLLSLPLSHLSLPLYIFPSTFLSLSFLLSLFSLSLSLTYLMDVFVLVIYQIQ